MKNLNFNLKIAFWLIVILAFSACKKSSNDGDDNRTQPVAQTWQEHWFEHNQVLQKVFFTVNI